jgi:hypothetical protein
LAAAARGARHSARALIERYRLWPALCHAYERVTRELGPVRVQITAERDLGRPYVRMQCMGAFPAGDWIFDFESALRSATDERIRPENRARLSIFLHPEIETAAR